MPFEKGHVPWNKGIPHKPETLERLKKALKGRKSPCGFLGKNHSAETRAKMSRTRKGRKRTWASATEFKPGHLQSNTGKTHFRPGKDHPQYVDGGAGELHRTAEYRRWRRAIKKRDKVCVRCGSDQKLEAHHIAGRDNTLENGICLCQICHRETHKAILSQASGTLLEGAETTGTVQSV